MVSRSPWLALMIVFAAISFSGCSRQTAEEKGKALATEKIDMVKGIGEALKEKGGQAAESVAQGTGGVFQGVGEGFDKAFEWKLNNGTGMEKVGLTVTRIDKGSSVDGKQNGVNAYIVAKQDTAGMLSMIAYDSAKREMARASVTMQIRANQGRYESLVLDERTPVKSIREVTFDFEPGAATDPGGK